MAYINVGAQTVSGQDFKSKKALKEAFASDPSSVIFYTTSAFDRSQVGDAGAFDPSDVLSVVGPNPYTSRKWYASVTKGKVS